MKRAEPFKLVECSGTAYEIGLQWSEGCRESLYQISENSFRNMEFMYQAKKEDVELSLFYLPTRRFGAIPIGDPGFVHYDTGGRGHPCYLRQSL